MNTKSLTDKLQEVTRRHLGVTLLAAVAWGLLALAVTILVAVWLDLLFELTPILRAMVPYLAATAALAVAIALLARGARSFTPQRVARLVDETAAACGSVLSGWDLLQAKDSAQAGPSETSRGLAQLAIDRAAERAAGVSAATAVPLTPAARPWGALLVATLVAAVFLLLAPQLARTEWRRFAHPWDDNPPPSSTELLVTPGDVDVRYGDPLDIFAEVRGETVDEVELVLGRGSQEETVPMFQEADGRWRAVLTRLTDPAEYHVRAFKSRSRRHQITILTVPQITGVEVEVTPPEYAQGIGAYRGNLPTGGVAGLRGTRVKFTATSHRPLEGGEIRVTTGSESTMLAMVSLDGSPETVVGEFFIESAGKFEFRVRDIDGQISRESVSGVVTLTPDQRPFVRMLQPRPVSLATPTALLPVEMAGEDDYGLSRFELYRSLNDSRPLPLEIPVSQPPPRRHRETVYLPLSEYGLEPGDQIKLSARVEDNDPAGAKGAESPVAVVHIISQEEFERMQRAREGLNVLMSKYRQAQRMLESLREATKSQRQQDDEKKGLVKKESRDQAAELAKQLRKSAEMLSKAAKQALPYDVDAQLTPQLEKLAEQLEQAAASLERKLERLGLEQSELELELEQLAGMLGEQSDLYSEAAMSPLQHLEQVMPMMVAQSRFQVLVQRQRDLANRLTALKGRDGEDNPALKARMRDLQEEQKSLRLELESLLSDIENGAQQLPEGEPFNELRQTALDFAAAVRESEAAAEMDRSESGLAEFSGTTGQRHADRAAEILEGFLSQNEGLSGQCESCLVFQPGFGQSLGQTAAQLLAEMGLGQGQGGSGAGSGGSGFSSRRGGNVGLYGGLPGMAGMEGMMAGQSGAAGGAGGDGQQGAAGGENPDQPSMLDLMTPGGTAGGGMGSVPLRYRERVGQYFRRLSEELQQSNDF